MTAHLYSIWRNVVANEANEPVVDRDIRTRCRHCMNAGLVIIDQTNEAAPCPMCMIGGRRAVEWATGTLAPRTAGCAAYSPPPGSFTGKAVDHYWHGADLKNVSWCNGLTIRHDRVCSTYSCENLVTSTGPCSKHEPTITQPAITQERQSA